MQIYWYDFVTL